MKTKILFIVCAALMALAIPKQAKAYSSSTDGIFQFGDSGSTYTSFKYFDKSTTLYTYYKLVKNSNWRAIADKHRSGISTIIIKNDDGTTFTMRFGTDSITGNGASFATITAAADWLNQAFKPGFKSTNIPNATAVAVRTGYTVIKSLVVTMAGGSNSYVNIWNSADSSGTLIAKVSLATVGKIDFGAEGIKCSVGVYIKQANVGTLGAATILYFRQPDENYYSRQPWLNF